DEHRRPVEVDGLAEVVVGGGVGGGGLELLHGLAQTAWLAPGHARAGVPGDAAVRAAAVPAREVATVAREPAVVPVAGGGGVGGRGRARAAGGAAGSGRVVRDAASGAEMVGQAARGDHAARSRARVGRSGDVARRAHAAAQLVAAVAGRVAADAVAA